MAGYLNVCKEPKHRTGFDRNFWIWEEYDPTVAIILLVVADVARGDGADLVRHFILLKLETLGNRLENTRAKPTPDLYANMLNQVGREFGNAMLW